MRVLAFCLLPWIFSGCVSVTPQAEKLLGNPGGLPPSARIEGVPFIQQSANYCGPAVLAMALNWAGDKAPLAEVAAQVYTPGLKGTLQSDMIGASRRRGLMAVPIQGMEALFAEVAAGHPVIVFENLALPWLPQWHYALVFGYDLQKQTVLMHSGPEAFKEWDLRKFERSWKLADYWGLVVLPAGTLAQTPGELDQVRAAVALEQMGKWEEADQAYQSLLKRWPGSLAPWIGRANIAYGRKNFSRAAQLLKEALRFHPGDRALLHNLAVAEEANH